MVKNLLANAGVIRDAGSIPGSEGSRGGGYAFRSSFLTWKVSWTEDPGGLRSIESQGVGHD